MMYFRRMDEVANYYSQLFTNTG